MSEEAQGQFFSTDFAVIMREIFIHVMNAIPEERRRSDAFFDSHSITAQLRHKIEQVYRSQAAFTPKARAKFVEIHWIALHVHRLVIEQNGKIDLVSFLKTSSQALLEGARDVRVSHEG